MKSNATKHVGALIALMIGYCFWPAAMATVMGSASLDYRITVLEVQNLTEPSNSNLNDLAFLFGLTAEPLSQNDIGPATSMLNSTPNATGPAGGFGIGTGIHYELSVTSMSDPGGSFNTSQRFELNFGFSNNSSTDTYHIRYERSIEGESTASADNPPPTPSFFNLTPGFEGVYSSAAIQRLNNSSGGRGSGGGGNSGGVGGSQPIGVLSRAGVLTLGLGPTVSEPMFSPLAWDLASRLKTRLRFPPLRLANPRRSNPRTWRSPSR